MAATLAEKILSAHLAEGTLEEGKEIGIRTVFNILGPLTCPAGARAQVLGVADESLAEKMAQALKAIGSRHVLVVHGEDGLDEITVSGRSIVYELKDGAIKSYYVTPEDFGLKESPASGMAGGDARTNAEILRNVLRGERGTPRDVVLMNASAALVAGDKAKTLKHGVDLAREAIDSGAALTKMEQLVKLTQSMS